MGAGLIQCGDDPEVTDAVGEAADGDTEPEDAAGVELGPQAAARSAAAAVAPRRSAGSRAILHAGPILVGSEKQCVRGAPLAAAAS